MFASSTHVHAETMMVVEASGSATQARAGGADRLVARFVAAVAAGGWQTRLADEAQQERVLTLLACDTSLCARAGLDGLGVNAVVAPSLWQRVDGHREMGISVQGPSGQLFELVVAVDPARPLDAADALAARFLAAWPTLAVGADDAVVDDVAPRPEPRARSAWNVPIGGAILVASIAPSVIGAMAIARDGECVDVDGQSACTVGSDGTIQRYHAGPRSYALLSLGVATAGFGIYVLAAGPIRVRPTIDLTARSAILGAAGTF